MRLGLFEYKTLTPTSSGANGFAKEIGGVVENVIITSHSSGRINTYITVKGKEYTFLDGCVPANIGQSIILHLDDDYDDQVAGVQLLNEKGEVMSRFISELNTDDECHFVK